MREESQEKVQEETRMSAAGLHDQPTEIRKAARNANRLLMLLTGIMVVLQLPYVFQTGENEDQLRLTFIVFLALFVLATYNAKIATADRRTIFLRHRDFVVRPLAEMKGFNVYFVLYALITLAVLVVGQMLFITDQSELVVGLAITTVLVVGVYLANILPSRTTVEPYGICTGVPSRLLRPFYPYGFIENVTLTRHMLTIKLVKKAPWSRVPRKIYVRGGAGQIAAALMAKHSVVNANIAPAVVIGEPRVPTISCPVCHEVYQSTASMCPKCGAAVPAEGYLGVVSGLDPNPVYAGVLLMVSAFTLALTGFLFFNLESYFQNIYGTGTGIYNVCGVFEWLFAIIAFAGGYTSVTRRHYGLARAGAIVSIIGNLASLVFGIAAWALLRRSSEQFED